MADRGRGALGDPLITFAQGQPWETPQVSQTKGEIGFSNGLVPNLG